MLYVLHLLWIKLYTTESDYFYERGQKILIMLSSSLNVSELMKLETNLSFLSQTSLSLGGIWRQSPAAGPDERTSLKSNRAEEISFPESHSIVLVHSNVWLVLILIQTFLLRLLCICLKHKLFRAFKIFHFITAMILPGDDTTCISKESR